MTGSDEDEKDEENDEDYSPEYGLRRNHANSNRRMRDQQQSGPPGPPGSRRRLNPRPSNSTVAGTSNSTPNDTSNGHPSHGGTSNAATDNTADGRTPMNHFLNPSKTDIRSSLHATALEDILQLAAAHPDGILGSLGHGKRTSWFGTNTAIFFRAPDGILSHWQSVVPDVLRRKFGQAQNLAKEILDRHHLNDQDGSAAEDVPRWAKLFRFFFDQQQNQQMRNSQSVRARDEQHQIAASLAGRQADNLPNAIVRSLESPYPSQPRTLTEIGNDFERTAQRLANATTEREITFYNRMLSCLEREMDDYDA